jgi:2-oxoglutarate dehydrogenase E2 component (dihydrolipoamide succinyltransferase)
MIIEIKAPTFPESVTDGTVATWYKKPGEFCTRDELLADIETDKVVIEINSPSDGSLKEILKVEGDTVISNELIAHFEKTDKLDEKPEVLGIDDSQIKKESDEIIVNPAAKKLLAENDMVSDDITGTGKGGRITKEDVQLAVHDRTSSSNQQLEIQNSSNEVSLTSNLDNQRLERRVPMTRLRSKVAERLLNATQTTAMLTTFNEVNMQPVINIRKQYKEQFEKSHNGTRLGFMSFFVRAASEALKRFPAVNASIDANDIVYHGYYDIGVAVSSDRGLVVPVLRDADAMSMATIESRIREFGSKAANGKLSIEDMTGGTFTITNGGIFGSLMSTPILNPPQTGILGMHKIQERPMAVDGKVEILPMMNLALSYDHRLIDGKEAVQFLVAIKDMIEDPARILLEL